VECHGTATLLGDPIEVAALTEAFTAQADGALRQHYCALGAVKPNIGHSNIAAGMGGLSKLVQALVQKKLPGQINFTALNPHIQLEGSPFSVQQKSGPWRVEAGAARLGGITCLGMGGTNVHMLLEEAPLVSTKTTASVLDPNPAGIRKCNCSSKT
jgi:acyl transferase domain-containing protein